MRVMAQMAMVMNLDKCIGWHTCAVTCQQAWTNRAGTEYVWFNNVETKPGIGYPKEYGGTPGDIFFQVVVNLLQLYNFIKEQYRFSTITCY